MRYLLNFIGMRSTSYYCGIFIADLAIYMIPCTLLWFVTYLLDIDIVIKHGALIYLIMIIFGLPIISLVYCL